HFIGLHGGIETKLALELTLQAELPASKRSAHAALEAKAARSALEIAQGADQRLVEGAGAHARRAVSGEEQMLFARLARPDLPLVRLAIEDRSEQLFDVVIVRAERGGDAPGRLGQVRFLEGPHVV